jgi:hypothetical protein
MGKLNLREFLQSCLCHSGPSESSLSHFVYRLCLHSVYRLCLHRVFTQSVYTECLHRVRYKENGGRIEPYTIVMMVYTDYDVDTLVFVTPKQPTTTMRILSFGGFDGFTQGGADAAKWLKST